MSEIAKEIDEAFKLLGAIPVVGDAVDIMAGVRSHLRKAYQLVKSQNNKEGQDG